eukprot:gene31538-6723_t
MQSADKFQGALPSMFSISQASNNKAGGQPRIMLEGEDPHGANTIPQERMVRKLLDASSAIPKPQVELVPIALAMVPIPESELLGVAREYSEDEASNPKEVLKAIAGKSSAIRRLTQAGKCDKCNVPLSSGGCKCDQNCDCKHDSGGTSGQGAQAGKCDKCNLPLSSGGCKCDQNCDCKQDQGVSTGGTSGGGTAVNCVVTGWGACSKTCGGGIQTRAITTLPTNGGTACPALLSQSCSDQACAGQNQTTNWAGANSFYLHALVASEQAKVLDAMQSAGMEVIRIFINRIDAEAKGSNCITVPDLEDTRVGAAYDDTILNAIDALMVQDIGVGAPYDDTILKAIDALMVQVVKRKMKLIIAMHDRYSLGCWGKDGYVTKYNIPTTEACDTDTAANNIIQFYNNPAAAADMDKRFAHILDHQNPFFNNRPWSSLSEAILGFDIQNEAQAHSPNRVIANRDWICSRAKLVKPKLSAGILVMTGGGADIWDSVIVEHFECPAIDVVCAHTYGDASQISRELPAAIQNAKKYGKRMILQEFGSAGVGKSSSLNSRILASLGLGLPWMVWQTFTNDAASWAVLTDRARQVNSGDDSFNSPGIFAWPELLRGTPVLGPGPGLTSSPGPTPSPTATCGTCNSPQCEGGQKCDKSNLPQSLGGCNSTPSELRKEGRRSTRTQDAGTGAGAGRHRRKLLEADGSWSKLAEAGRRGRRPPVGHGPTPDAG